MAQIRAMESIRRSKGGAPPEPETELDAGAVEALDHARQGLALIAQGKLDEAVLRFREVVRLQPGSAEAHSDLGNSLRLLGRCDEAIACLDTAIRLRPDYALGHLNLGLSL